MASTKSIRTDLIDVRRSKVHGQGVFALAKIAKGERLIEYLGERVSHKEADRRYESKSADDAHTFLFIVNSRTVIDAGVDGNDARFFNYSCNPNCESVIEGGRVYIDTLRAIEPGEELTYDYQLYRDHDDPADIDQVFACRCGAPQCRGTMLWPPEKPKRKRRKRARTQPVGAGKVGARQVPGTTASRGRTGRSAGRTPAGRDASAKKSTRRSGAGRNSTRGKRTGRRPVGRSASGSQGDRRR